MPTCRRCWTQNLRGIANRRDREKQTGNDLRAPVIAAADAGRCAAPTSAKRLRPRAIPKCANSRSKQDDHGIRRRNSQGKRILK